MSLDSIRLFSVLKRKMDWHQTRQTLLAENVANADTPDFEGRDLAPFKLSMNDHIKAMAPVGVARTDKGHIGGTLMSTDSSFRASNGNGWEITPEGNGVVLEEQMMKVTGNAFDYQVASTLYSRSLGILKTALK